MEKKEIKMRKPRVRKYKTAEEFARAQLDNINRRNRDKMTAFTFRFNNEKDGDIIQYIRMQPSQMEWIRHLIRREINR